MIEQKRHTSALRIYRTADEPDSFVVLSDGSEPDAIPVIPTALSMSYWAHPSRFREAL